MSFPPVFLLTHFDVLEAEMAGNDSADKEQALLSNARDGIQLLVNQIWAQPTRLVDDALVAALPPVTTNLPREKPVSHLSSVSHPLATRIDKVSLGHSYRKLLR